MKKEKGVIRKSWGGRLSFLFLFPNSYFVGMSNLSTHLFYRIVNGVDGLLCERAFADEKGKYLSLESRKPLSEFDVVGFSLSYEKDVIEVIKALESSRIPPERERRKGLQKPIIMAGGIVPSLNPEPLSPIFDLILIEEWEDLPEVLMFLRERKFSLKWDKEELIDEVERSFPQVLNPEKLELSYRENRVTVTYKGKVKRIDKKRLWDRFPAFTTILSDEVEFPKTFLVETVRGCPARCKFCAVSHVYPFRIRKREAVIELVKKHGNTLPRVGLVGPGLGFHPELTDIVSDLLSLGKGVTFSSLRVESLDDTFFQLLPKTGVRSITIAPEVGDEEKRFNIGKKMTDEDIFKFLDRLPDSVKRIRIYFMIGLPGESEKDLEKMVKLVENIDKRTKGKLLSLSISPFVPKPRTPLEDYPMDTMESLSRKRKIIEKKILRKWNVHFESPKWSTFQALISLGDRRIYPLLKLVSAGNTNFTRFWRSFEFDPYEILYGERSKPWNFLNIA